MNARPLRLLVLCPLLLTAAAHAAYVCGEPPTPVDRRACEAARESPEALRHFVQRMNWLRHNLNFFDYVDEKTQLAWQQRAQRTASAALAIVG